MQSEPVNILFVEADSELSISELQQAGMIAVDETYASQKIWTNTWAYGNTLALTYLDAYSGISLSALTWAQEWAKGMQSSVYNVWFISRGQGGGANPLVAQFGKKLEYTMALSHLDIEQSKGEIIMQFSPGTIHPVAKEFTPQLASLVKGESLVYIEFQDLLGALGLPDEQVVSLLPLILTQSNPALANLLSQEDYADVVAVLHDNIAITLEVTSGGWIGLWAVLLLRHPKADALAKILKPALRGVVETFLGTWVVSEQVTEQWFTLHIAIPWLVAMLGNGPLVEFAKLPWDAGSALGVLLDTTTILWDWINDLVYTPKSIASFSIDTKAMERLQKSAPDASIGGLAAGQYLTQWVIKWHIVLDEDAQQVRLIYQVSDES